MLYNSEASSCLPSHRQLECHILAGDLAGNHNTDTLHIVLKYSFLVFPFHGFCSKGAALISRPFFLRLISLCFFQSTASFKAKISASLSLKEEVRWGLLITSSTRAVQQLALQSKASRRRSYTVLLLWQTWVRPDRLGGPLRPRPGWEAQWRSRI